jgi:hypothetical protein
MQFDITVIQVNEVNGKKNQRGGQYDQVELVYKREGKVDAKAFPDFANKEIYDILKGLVKDGNYQVTTEKVGDFWKWLSVVPLAGGGVQSPAAEQSATASPVQSKAATGKVLGSNYETKEERTARQKLIVAQSSLSSAIDLLGKSEPKGVTQDAHAAVKLAEFFYNWVFSVATRDLSNITNDIPE